MSRRAASTAETTRGHDLRGRVGVLKRAVIAGGAQLDRSVAADAEALVGKVSERMSLAGGYTVVALAGATGSGKSSLFNALTGSTVATVGVVRPTTSTALAACWGSTPPADLLDWLGVGRRHLIQDPGGAPEADDQLSLDGLVLLDLPDFDSRVTSHRAEVDRLLALVDVFVWVTDPQKYADARMHEEYVAALRRHGAVMITVLNQADRLSPEGVLSCERDLRRLLVEDGLADPEVIVTCAMDGSGVIALHHRISAVIAGHQAAAARLAADLQDCAGRLADGVGGREASLEGADRDLVEALSRAAGVPVVADAVERDYRRRALATTGWPFTRWARHLRPSPLRRIGLSRSGQAPPEDALLTQADLRSVLGRSSLPRASPAARSAVRVCARRLADRAAAGLPEPWADAVLDSAQPPEEDLLDRLDQAVVGTSLRTSNPWWWALVATVQTLGALAVLVGFVWLAVLALIGWLRLPQPYDPTFGPLPVPFVLFGGGLLLGLLLTLTARALARAGGRRRRAIVERRLREAISAVAKERLVAPVQAVLRRHRQARELLAELRI